MLIDCHNDTILKVLYDREDFANGSPNLHIDLPKIRSARNVAALFFAAWCDPVYEGNTAFLHAVELLRAIKNLARENSSDLALALSMRDLVTNAEDRRTSVILAVEGAQPINDCLENLAALYEEGVRLITLCHLQSPPWVGSCHEEVQHGLESFGYEVVSAMNDLGMIVDLAHASEQSIIDAAAATKAPVLSSHSCAQGIFDSPRGLSDQAIRAIAETGGAVGIMFFPDVLAPRSDTDWNPVHEIDAIFRRVDADEGMNLDEKAKCKLHAITREFRRPDSIPDVEVVFRHIDYVVRLVGDDHVALGSDFDGIPYSCDRLEHIGQIANLTESMRGYGYSEARIEKITGLNARRVMEAVFG